MAQLSGYPLHEVPHFIKDCAAILNEEWKRSETARTHVLKKSQDTLPYNIAYVKNLDGKEEVVGHSRLARVQGDPKACFVESVVVQKCLRGQGLGRKLMEETEKHAQRLGFDTMYLTTHDKQDFYHHLGYRFCESIVSIGSASAWVANCLVGKLSDRPATVNDHSSNQCLGGVSGSQEKSSENGDFTPIPATAPPPPPPPPPLPPNLSKPESDSSVVNAVCPPPPPAPSLPPIPPGYLNNSGRTSSNSTLISNKKESLSWMKKKL